MRTWILDDGTIVSESNDVLWSPMDENLIYEEDRLVDLIDPNQACCEHDLSNWESNPLAWWHWERILYTISLGRYGRYEQ